MTVTREDRLLTMPEVADYLGVSLSWLKKRVTAAQVPHVRLGKNIRFTWDNVDEIIQQSQASVTVRSGRGRL